MARKLMHIIGFVHKVLRSIEFEFVLQLVLLGCLEQTKVLIEIAHPL